MQYFFKRTAVHYFTKTINYLHYHFALIIQQIFKSSKHLKLLSLDRSTDSLNYTLLPPY